MKEKYVILNDYEECEIYIRKIFVNDENDIKEYKDKHSKIGTETLSKIVDNYSIARELAIYEAQVNLWKYNPDRNFVTVYN